MSQLYQHEAARVPAEEFVPEHVLKALEDLILDDPQLHHRQTYRDHQHGYQNGHQHAETTAMAVNDAAAKDAIAADADHTGEDREARENTQRQVTFR